MVVFPGLLFYIIAVLFVRRTAVIHPGLCEVHRTKRRRAIWIAWALILLSFVLWWAAFRGRDVDFALFWLGIATLVAGAIWGVRGSTILAPQKIDKRYAWLKGASPAFLNELPDSPVLR